MRMGSFMREKCRFWLGVLALLSVFAVCAPGQAWAGADIATSIATQCGPAGKVDPKNAFDNNAAGYLAAYQKNLAYAANDASIAFPVQQVSNCVQNIVNAISLITSMLSAVDGLDAFMIAAVALAKAAVMAIIQSVCSQVMAAVKAVGQDILNAATICLPLPSFGFDLGLNIPSVPPCALNNMLGFPGGMPVHLLGAGAPVMGVPSYNLYQFFKGN